MIRAPFLPILLTAALIAQSVMVGWGHSHAHPCGGLGLPHVSHGAPGIASYSLHFHAAGDQHHLRDSHEHPSLPNRPADKDDCSICRHLALAAIVTLDLEAVAVGDIAEAVQEREFSLVSTIAIGLRRPRSPPELS